MLSNSSFAVEGKWYLGMNLNPDDGHIMDYTTGWDDGYNIGSPSTALVKDYLSSEVWDMPVNSIAIVRHQKVCREKDFFNLAKESHFAFSEERIYLCLYVYPLKRMNFFKLIYALSL